jgi:lysophospholipase L1-like esterase
LKKKFLIALMMLLLLPALHRAADDFALKDGDRVVFYGDSITQDGTYAELVEWYTATRFPERNITFYYSGVGGDRVSGGGAGPIEQRLNRDVIAWQPTVVTIMLGMNDASYRLFDPDFFKTYCDGYRKIVTRLKAALPGVRLTLIQPSPFDDISHPPQFEGGYDAVLRRYGQFVAELAKEQEATLVDFGTPVNQGLQKLMQEDPALARLLIPDRVHPGTAGHFLMGIALLRAWHAPGVISQVTLDAAQAKVLTAENSSVIGIDNTGSKLRWKQTDKAFPLPINFSDGEIEFAERAGAGFKELDQQVLTVKGLSAGNYELTINGQPIVKATEIEWDRGINLVSYHTPMYWENSMPIRWSVGGRKEMQTVRREVQVSSAKEPSLSSTAEALEKLQLSLRNETRLKSSLKTYNFELKSSSNP